MGDASSMVDLPSQADGSKEGSGDARPIGFFDSGVGGLTVLREVVRRLPRESTVYLGDTARTPYGPRSDAEVIQFSSECIDHLTAWGVKAIVVACNTATSVALDELRRRSAVPMLGVVRPGATAAALATRNERVGVIATQATVRSHAYRAAILDENPRVDVVEHATPALVPLVESGQLDGPKVIGAVMDSLAPLLSESRDQAIDTLLLGCTHYPLLAHVIERITGPEVAVIDSASATASALASLIEVHGHGAPLDAEPNHIQLTTGDVEAFRERAMALFGDAFASVRHVDVSGVRAMTIEHPVTEMGRSVAVAPGR